MQMGTQWKIAAAVAAVLVLGAAGIFANQAGWIRLGGEGGVASSTAPSLTKGVKYTASLPEEVKTHVMRQIEDDRESLSKNYEQYDVWLRLAVRYKQAGDYEKAREVWEYLANYHLDDAISRHNLGDLYHHFTIDYAKAEQNYLAAIDADAFDGVVSSPATFLALHELYRDAYKQDTMAAADILEAAVERIQGPGVIDMYSALGQYQQSRGRTQEAIEAYRNAAREARAAGNAQLAARFEAEMAALQ